MKLQEILQHIDDTTQLIDSGNLGAAKSRLATLKQALGGAQQVNVVKEDTPNCPSCASDGKTRVLQGKKPGRWCHECGWREDL